MSTVNLGELQRTYRAWQGAERRNALRRYLIESEAPSPAAFRLVSRYLYAGGQIDCLGLTDLWLGTPSMRERAALFSAITTAMLGT
jgi:hypothetical protein